MKNIPFNKPYLHGKELVYISNSVASGKISGDGKYTKYVHEFINKRYGFKKPLLTTSCTDALEMCAILLNISPGDEVIVPSYTFVSTANAFVLRGAKIIFADSSSINPNIDSNLIESLITKRTKAIVIVHYAGVACDIDPILEIAKKFNLYLIEDAAQAIDSYYNGKVLGSFGIFSAFSFHETKNIICGEGGLFVSNSTEHDARAEIIREKGTNRSSFFRGEVNKYGWVDIGSSFLPSDINAAYLYAQLENIDVIQSKRVLLHNRYYKNLLELQSKEFLKLPIIPPYATNNAHMFYIICRSLDERTALTNYLKSKGIFAVFHYVTLHNSAYFKDKHDERILINAENYSNQLLRLPIFYELNLEDVDFISQCIYDFFKLI